MGYKPTQQLSEQQLTVINLPLNAKAFVKGPAGCGKTTAAVERVLHLMTRDVPGNDILVLLPQRTLARPFQDALGYPGILSGGVPDVITIGGLARRMVDLFWPVFADRAGFDQPGRPPTFLTLETTQYFMARLVQPLLDQGLFQSVTIDRNRLYSQIVDNLNKAALVRFPHTQVGERLKGASSGDPAKLRIYDDVQVCVNLFRDYCFKHNLLDFSLQIELFYTYIWADDQRKNDLVKKYPHIIVDNIEEDNPATHDLLIEWLPLCDTATMIFDDQAGYRRILGADPLSAQRIATRCSFQLVIDTPLVSSPQIQAIRNQLELIFNPGIASSKTSFVHEDRSNVASAALRYRPNRFVLQMLDWVVGEVQKLLVDEGIKPGEIVILAPYLSDALRYSLMERLKTAGVATRSHRPSRSLREEPATQCLLTLSSLAYPEWGIKPTRYDVAYALLMAIRGIDLVRAQLLADAVFQEKGNAISIISFGEIKPDLQARITYRFGEYYQYLYEWLLESHSRPGLFDHFISRLFGEVLSQPNYGFHTNYDAGKITTSLVESIYKFRQCAGKILESEGIPLGKEFISMVQSGVIAAQYLSAWEDLEEDAVLIAPAYTYLMSNRPVMVQFWLDIASPGWSERLEQPLTHPYVLSRNWQLDRIWTDSDEVEVAQTALRHLVVGLMNRCRYRIYLGLCEFGENGYEQRGALLHAFQRYFQGTTSIQSFMNK